MNLIRDWNTFWFRSTSARPLAAFRIVFGLMVLLHLAIISFELDYWYTDAGLWQGAESRIIAGPMRPSLLHWMQSPTAVHIFFAVSVAAAVGLTLGWRTRWMAGLVYFTMLSYHHRNIPGSGGPDLLLILMAFYLTLSPAGAAYSLDARRAARRRGTVAEPLIVPWAQRLIQVQVAIVYVVAAMWKFHGIVWLNGTAVHIVINNAEFNRYRFDPISAWPVAINLLTYGAMATEVALPIFLWFRKTRPWIMFWGVALHFGILFMVNVPLFGEILVACYLTFLSPEEFDALLYRLNPKNWFRRAPAIANSHVIPGRVDEPSALPAPHVAEPISRPSARRTVATGRRSAKRKR